MKYFNIYEVDGNLLRAFIVILDETSVSKAAIKLGVTQSAVSHMLRKLRHLIGDPLFVRSGQGLVPTETALSLRKTVENILEQLQSLTHERKFVPENEDLHFRIAANDLQRELIFPQLFHESRQKNISLKLEFIPSGVPDVELLRRAEVELAVTPLPPDAPDLFMRKFYNGNMVCYYDSNCRSAPQNLEDYLDAEHISVTFANKGTSFDVIAGDFDNSCRKISVSVSNFNGITNFVKNSNLLATELDLMSLGPLKELDSAVLPFKTREISLFMVWHERSNRDPALIWLRNEVIRIASKLTPLS